MLTRPIPSSGETLPIVGLGTYRGFDVSLGGGARERLAGVLEALLRAGGTVIDASPMYGRAEAVAGELLAEAAAREKTFVATKVWTRGRRQGTEQMRRSVTLLRSQVIDLMQVHNLVDWRTHLATLRAWKDEGLVRYLGVTHYTASAFDQLEAVMRAGPLDFVQLNYSLEDRAAEHRLLPLAAERGIAVLVNVPFGGGGLLRRLARQPLPTWADQIGCASWSQVLLKYVLGHPAVTCAIPGTGQPEHMAANALAGEAPLPDQAIRRRMAAAFDAL